MSDDHRSLASLVCRLYFVVGKVGLLLRRFPASAYKQRRLDLAALSGAFRVGLGARGRRRPGRAAPDPGGPCVPLPRRAGAVGVLGGVAPVLCEADPAVEGKKR